MGQGVGRCSQLEGGGAFGGFGGWWRGKVGEQS